MSEVRKILGEPESRRHCDGSEALVYRAKERTSDPYNDGLVIDPLPNGKFYLIIDRSEYTFDDLPSAEAKLAEYAKSEGWGDD